MALILADDAHAALRHREVRRMRLSPRPRGIPDSELNWRGEIGKTITADQTRQDLARLVPGQTVEITLDTPGGVFAEAQAIAQLLERRTGHVRVVVPSRCHSAGLLLLAAADFRYARAEATFHFHPVAALVAARSAPELRRQATRLRSVDIEFALSLAARCRATSGRILQLFLADRAISAAEAVSIGLVHGIVIEP